MFYTCCTLGNLNTLTWFRVGSHVSIGTRGAFAWAAKRARRALATTWGAVPDLRDQAYFFSRTLAAARKSIPDLTLWTARLCFALAVTWFLVEIFVWRAKALGLALASTGWVSKPSLLKTTVLLRTRALTSACLSVVLSQLRVVAVVAPIFYLKQVVS